MTKTSVGNREPRFLLAEDDLLHGGAAATAELGFPGDARVTGVELHRLPALRAFEVVAAARLERADVARLLGRDGGSVGFEPRPAFVSPGGVFG